MKLIGVDVGGTFTDIVFCDTESGQIAIHKLPTTLEDPSVAVIDGIEEICRRNAISKSDVDHVFHGTTIATNAVLEYDGATTGMVTTKGYRDVLHIGRHQRPENYSIMQDIPWQDRPLVPRRFRKTVTERLVPPTGEVLVPLNEDEVRGVVTELKDAGVESIVVGFLFSYLNSAHEQRAKEIILEIYPEAYVTISSEISPQFREFERFTTAAINGFIGPKVQRYVRSLKSRLFESGIRGELRIMCSNGGVATPEAVSEKPANTLLSGPAAGVLGGQWFGNLAGRQNLITFDVGGTSADIGIVTEKGFSESAARDTWIAGYPIMVPMIDIHTIGAGGGSIAYTDEGGAFKVGPRSAGSRPGPACYGHGGTKPTVSDANVVLGRIDQDNFLGGEMQIHGGAAHRVINEFTANVNLSATETAEGIITILNNNMANAIRAKTIQKGYDPREFSIVAFGGAGPLHAAEVAMILGVPEVIVPPHPGITSATGLLTTDLKYDVIKTEFMVNTSLDIDRMNADLELLMANVRTQLHEDGIPTEDVQVSRSADCRYVGQGYELRIPLPNGQITESNLQEALAVFHEVHKAEYGHSFLESFIEIVNIRVTGNGTMPKLKRNSETRHGTVTDAAIKTSKTVFRVAGKLQEFETIFYARDRLPIDTPISGPAIVLQQDTTTVIPPGCVGHQEAAGNMIIRIGGTDNESQ